MSVSTNSPNGVGATASKESRLTPSLREGQSHTSTSSMTLSDIPHLLKYNITTVDGGVLLSIWEPASKSEIRVKPFLYMVKYRFASEADARNFLRQYASVYNSMPQTPQGSRG